MKDFDQIYKLLNTKQRQAVDQVDGPLLVIAGPGTGKTQLLSARVANILKSTDTLAQNILCLTFTESGAKNMQERLTAFIGQTAYNVQISTYHTFGSDIIKRYPEFFENQRFEQPIDDLSRRSLVEAILEKLPYSNSLKPSLRYPGDLISTISDIKRNLLNPKDLQELAKQNSKQIESISPEVAKIFAGLARMPSGYKKSQPYFEQVASILYDYANPNPKYDLASSALTALSAAMEDAADAKSSTPLTAWKNAWLYKNADNNFVFTDHKLSAKLNDLALVLDLYQKGLAAQGLYDFDDMILRSIQAIEEFPELKFNLQEQNQYLLLDEFQDTNAAQLKLVELLTDNPINEGRPNAMAVGDDDQAIYAFQGASSSNMLKFAKMFNDTQVINLSKNYRSTPQIVDLAKRISGQISDGLASQLTDLDKSLESAITAKPKSPKPQRIHLQTSSNERSWIAQKILDLSCQGVDPSDIAVLAPKHKYLEALVPYINELGIAVAYEKRENILDTVIVKQLHVMAKLTHAISSNDTSAANQLFPEVLSYEFHKLPIASVWKTNWQFARRDNMACWAELASNEPSLVVSIGFFNTLGLKCANMGLEETLDTLIGNRSIDVAGTAYNSPLKDYYFGTKDLSDNPNSYYQTLSHLSAIRDEVRARQLAQTAGNKLALQDFLDLFNLYQSAGQPLLDNQSVQQSDSAVNLLTAYKAKGLEFEHVIVMSALDSVWGPSARSNFNRVTLPANLKPIRHAGATPDERLRLFFVALTRAKTGLYMSSYQNQDNGKQNLLLRFLDERRQEDDTIESTLLPEGSQTALQPNINSNPNLSQPIELEWGINTSTIKPSLKSLLKKRLDYYRLSPTHLNTFIDLSWGGPQTFLLNNLLRFPQAPGIDGEYGNAIHQTLDWYQAELNTTQKHPTMQILEENFTKQLDTRYIDPGQKPLLLERGISALNSYLAARSDTFAPGDKSEANFKSEGVLVGEAHLTGNIDKIEIDKKNKLITVVDYKTGQAFDKWSSNLKLFKYRQQLYFYKILVEQSNSYQGYKVQKGRLEFIEPSDDGRIMHLELTFEDQELIRLKQLIQVVWRHITTLDLPDTSGLGSNLADVKQFIDSLIQDKN